jgi:hypothetical protein
LLDAIDRDIKAAMAASELDAADGERLRDMVSDKVKAIA